jgi:hypothetical protein
LRWTSASRAALDDERPAAVSGLDGVLLLTGFLTSAMLLLL